MFIDACLLIPVLEPEFLLYVLDVYYCLIMMT